MQNIMPEFKDRMTKVGLDVVGWLVGSLED